MRILITAAMAVSLSTAQAQNVDTAAAEETRP